MTTLSEKNPSRAIRAQAPRVGIHLPTPNDRIAAHTPNQMNASAKTYLPTPPRSPKNVLNVSTAVMQSTPPIHTGVDSQYRTVLMRATKRPKARRVQT